MSTQSRVEHAEPHRRGDGLQFEVRVVRVGAEFWGRWTCHECGSMGGSRRHAPSVAEAALSAHSSLQEHPCPRQRDSSSELVEGESAGPSRPTLLVAVG